MLFKKLSVRSPFWVLVGVFLVSLPFVGLSFSLLSASEASAQSAPPPPGLAAPCIPEEVLNRERIHLSTIGTYSAGFVLQAYGYIGVLADVLSQGVYEPDIINSMLGETVTYLQNASVQLKKYQGQEMQISKGDQAFINGINSIINDLVQEALALQVFAEKREDNELKKFNEYREKAWAGIKKTLGVK
ncbi:MAG: hypothetical protein LBV23_01410 [Deltaproteobacteria bacterium]|jgi:hypothetical protein|nr:hypothetical protein [Deltaproteobacteria bacterium]